MLPVLVDFEHLKIYTFGIFLVLAFFWSVYLLWRNVRLTSYKEDEVFDGVFMSLGVGLFVGRFVYIATHFNDFGFDILKFILINGYPGLSLYGAIIGAFLGLYLYLLVKKIKFVDIIDYFVAPAFVALGIGKIGSFFSGIEVGAQTKWFLALKYAGSDGFRHLTALYEGLLFFLGAFISYKILFEIRRGKYSKGFTFFFLCWYFGLVYFVFDPLKSSHLAMFGNTSFNSYVSLILLLTFTIYFLYYFRDLLLDRTRTITNSLFSYGQNIYSSARKKTKRGEGKDSKAD